MKNSQSTLVEGLVVTELKQIYDDRGGVLHMLRSDAEDFTKFGECYFSEVLPGAVKAWKKHHLQTQNLAVPVGTIRLVIYDGRETSATKGCINIFDLGRPDAYQRIQIPPGLWYGFSNTGTTPALLANCADIPHSKSESEVLDLADPAIPYSWQ